MPKRELSMKKLVVVATFTDPILGTYSNNPDIHLEYIASKSADKEKVQQEMENLPADVLQDRAKTVFPRKDGVPIFYDYQVKGFLKAALSTVVEFEPYQISKTKKVSKYTHKRVASSQFFVYPREIPIVFPEGGEITECTRPLRAETPLGERTALMTSEECPEGSKIEFSITVMTDELVPLVTRLIKYGEYKGLGQWRNAGKGRFKAEIVEIVDLGGSSKEASKGDK
jgi:hypothetical protein